MRSVTNLLWIPIALSLLSQPVRGQQYIISTLNFVPGLVGGNGWGVVTLDAAGNLYFPSADNRIMKLTPSLVLSTVAGNGSSGCSGDGGQATAAALAGPNHVAVDSTGNVYIAHAGYPSTGCTWAGYIRKVAPGGTISTVVSELYDQACAVPQFCNSLYLPQGMVLDGAGNLSIADAGHSWILKGPASGFGPASTWPIQWVMAGDKITGKQGYADGTASSALFQQPMGMAADAAGNLYVADTYNHRVRKLTADGNVSTVAGNGTAGYSGDGGQATLASLNRPADVAVDAAGNLYIADLDNARIRKVGSGGIISTIAGNGDPNKSYYGDGGPASVAALCGPSGIAVDSSHRVFFLDSCSSPAIRILTLPPTTTTVTGIAPEPSVGGQPYMVSFTVSSDYGVIAVGVNVTVSDGTQTCADTIAHGSCQLASPTAGAKTITATYPGDDHYRGSSATAAHTVNKADSIATITSNLSAATVAGQSYTVAFTVVAKAPGSGTPSGSVTVSDGSQSCSATVAQASCSLTSQTAGTKNITATYAGDANFNGSVSTGVSHTVTDTTPAAPSRVDAVVTVNVNKRNTVYTGAVTWQDNSNNETGFRIRRLTSSSGTCAVEAAFSATVGANVSSYTDASAGATTCGYGVASYNATGTSAYADDTNVVSGPALAAPANVNAVMTVTTKGKNSVYDANITWGSTGKNVSNFLVRRYITSGSGCAVDIRFGTAVLAANKSSYADSNASASTCAYAVAAANSAGISVWIGDQDLTASINPF